MAGATAADARPAATEIVTRLKTSDIEAIATLTATLNRDLPLTTWMRCPAQYTLILTVADGTAENLSYHCLGGEPAGLWGDQAIRNIWAIDAPADFRSQFELLLAGAG